MGEMVDFAATKFMSDRMNELQLKLIFKTSYSSVEEKWMFPEGISMVWNGRRRGKDVEMGWERSRRLEHKSAWKLRRMGLLFPRLGLTVLSLGLDRYRRVVIDLAAKL